MKIIWESEHWPGAKIEPSITYLSWIPQVDQPEHGLLGVGSDSGSVGITLTDFKETPDDNSRYNFNLRGHHTAIRMVTWNKSQSKLASCDASGIIYVWVRNDDRWSVELVNDRGVKVNDLSWSPCGSSALICYEDNFVLIGSASGQRVWSNSFPTGPATTVTCGVWAPDSKMLVLGFSSGSFQVLSNLGANITERSFTNDRLQQMAFSPLRGEIEQEEWTLAMLTTTNKIIMINAYDQLSPSIYRSNYNIIHMQWNSHGTILALINSNHELIMLDTTAKIIHKEKISIANSEKPLTAFTWAHDGKCVIVAAGGHLAIGKILFGVPSLFDIVAYNVWKAMGSSAKNVNKLPIPTKEMDSLKLLDHHIIRCRIPKLNNLCNFVCSVIEARCYCTIRPVARGSHTYMLCIEHLGGLVPLLIGRQVNRFLPQFQIFLYQSNNSNTSISTPGSSAQVEDVNSMIRNSNSRNSLWRRSKRQIRALMSRHVRPQRTDSRLVQVSSNVWCTRFNITSMSHTNLPQFLGQVIYKTSVLHLQPRQMTIDLSVLDDNSTTNSTTNVSKQTETTPITSSQPTTSKQQSNDQGLTEEERLFFEKVVTECLSLRAAMDATVYKETTHQETCQPSTSRQTESAPVTPSKNATPVSVRTTDSRLEVTSMASSVSTWHDEIETLEFIDGDEDKGASSSSASKGGWPIEGASKKDTDAIRVHVDKLASIAAQLSKRHVDFNAKRDKASINKMRSQMKELLRRVNEIEKKVGSGDVKIEVRQLLKTLEEMKKALGESSNKTNNSATNSNNKRTVTMHNKTPFWNEHNQVYQLDFGGRVTQESAKNFQIEMDGKQVLQFGRIEGGAYTLDFRHPFSASQAFAVALASITQRLK
ncbi:unnamed protein product [Caenorhabditis angaria]|uniref:Uncharacterized protein n=1 Tax=Caenorhabditis angaria TaxID=860376 RepID=B6VBV6_9PELO|nr:hypothetical protein Csp3_JD03.008 [Caenorhabditis angaria]CAI5438687.1 unnamed protein product [Caenorhabditis angaria]